MKKILLIEDENSLRNDVADMLTFEGFEVLTAENGLIGLQKVESEMPDLILCDVMMPEMDGFQVLTHLKNKSETSLIPFIFLTALSERENTRNGMNLGADDYIVKPFTRDELLNAVNACLKKINIIREKEERDINDIKLKLIRFLPHEFRTPLNGIVGFGQLLANDADKFSTAEITEFGKNIYHSALILNKLIQNYLLYAELEFRSNAFQGSEVLDISGVFCKFIAEQIAEKFDRLNDLVFENAGGKINLDQEEFSKIIEELLENAFKYSKKGTPVVLSIHHNSEYVFISIEDKGHGMTAAEIKNIGAFTQFNRQLHEQQGSGLGLIIARKLVEVHQGTLEIFSVPDSGTTIKIKLPYKP